MKQKSGPRCTTRFNPHAREGRDADYLTFGLVKLVSIHTPVKGATITILQLGVSIFCFNPHAREGRDYPVQLSPPAAPCFNPHAREGRDSWGNITWFLTKSFNPHAREGRDILSMMLMITLGSFNPHAREGRDMLWKLASTPHWMFQSTRP